VDIAVAASLAGSESKPCEVRKLVTLPGRTREPRHRDDHDAGHEPRRYSFAGATGLRVASPGSAASRRVAHAPHATWLTFRRTYSSWSHDKGVPGKVVAQLMGHCNVDTTLNVYTQVLDGSVRDAVEKIGSELITIVHFSETADPVSH
jgi:integrase